MTISRIAAAGLLALAVFSFGPSMPTANAAPPPSSVLDDDDTNAQSGAPASNTNGGNRQQRRQADDSYRDNSNPAYDDTGGNRRQRRQADDVNTEDGNLGSAQGEIERVITPEYRRQGMRVERLPNGNLRLLLPSEVLFAYDSADIRPAFTPTLQQVARIMERRPRIRAQVIGHTDSNGSDSYNLDLSLRRAESVAESLRYQGVERWRLSTDGRGKREPVASNATPEGQRLNRRVEIILFRPARGERQLRN